MPMMQAVARAALVADSARSISNCFLPIRTHASAQAAYIAERLTTGSRQGPSAQEAAAAPTQPAGVGNGKAGRGMGLKQLLASHQNALLEDERLFLTDAAALLQVFLGLRPQMWPSQLCTWADMTFVCISQSTCNVHIHLLSNRVGM